MKLAYIANIRLPTEKAHGIQIMSMAEAFAKNGVTVTLIVSKRKTPTQEDPFSFYGIKKIFEIERLSAIDFTHLGHVLRAPAYHLERLSFSRNALRYARKKQADIFYTRDELTLFVFAKNNLPIVFEMHTLPRRMKLYKKAFEKTKKIVVITEHLKQALMHAGVPQEKIIVAPDGVDINRFKISTDQREARKKFNLPQEAYVALYAGLLDEWKGYQILLEASETLHQQGVQVVIAGGTATQVDLLSQKYPKVIFLGFRRYEDMPLLQRAADVLLIPNSAKFPLGALYTSPLKVFTSMASGVPIVASDVPALREVLRETTAHFFKPDETDSLIKTILSVKNDPEIGKRTALQALEESTRYSWDVRAKKIIDSLS